MVCWNSSNKKVTFAQTKVADVFLCKTGFPFYRFPLDLPAPPRHLVSTASILSSSIHSPCIVLRPGVFPVLSPSMGKACSCWTPVIGSMVGMWPKSGRSEPRSFNSRIFVWAVSESLGFRFERWGSCRQFIITKERLLENGTNPGAESRGASKRNPKIPLNPWTKAPLKPTYFRTFK